jgi:hypothetical protein
VSKSVTRFERVFARFASRAAYAILAFSFVAAVLVGALAQD